MKLLVKNGMIATESQVFRGDILIEDEKIKSIGTVLEEEDAEVIAIFIWSFLKFCISCIICTYTDFRSL